MYFLLDKLIDKKRLLHDYRETALSVHSKVNKKRLITVSF